MISKHCGKRLTYFAGRHAMSGLKYIPDRHVWYCSGCGRTFTQRVRQPKPKEVSNAN